MTKSLVRVEPESINNAVDEVLNRTRSISLPLDEKPIGLNDINILSYTIIEEALYDMKPSELSFVAQMANTASISDRQRNWIKKIAINYIGIDVDAKQSDGSFTVTVQSSKDKRTPSPDNDNPKAARKPRRKAA